VLLFILYFLSFICLALLFFLRFLLQLGVHILLFEDFLQIDFFLLNTVKERLICKVVMNVLILNLNIFL
jgi:hypothetical protein